MKLLIIGSSGFVGSYLAAETEKSGIDYIGTSRKQIGGKNEKFDIKTDDIQNVVKLHFNDTATSNVAVICSSVCKIDLCKTNFEESYIVNVTGTKKIVDTLDDFGFKTVFISTDNVFDGEKGYYSETDVATPVNEYGRQKRNIEKYLLERSENNLVLRLSKVVGCKSSEPHPFDEWYRLATQHKEIYTIRGNIFSPTYVFDVAKGILCAIKNGLTGVYHLCNNEHFSRTELAQQFVNYFGFDTPVYEKDLECFGFVENRPLKSYMCSDKFRNATDFSFTSMRAVMEKMEMENI